MELPRGATTCESTRSSALDLDCAAERPRANRTALVPDTAYSRPRHQVDRIVACRFDIADTLSLVSLIPSACVRGNELGRKVRKDVVASPGVDRRESGAVGEGARELRTESEGCI